MIGNINEVSDLSGFFNGCDGAEYAVGVTFGADLEVWRKILKKLFGDEFKANEKFDKALLITDKTVLTDSSPKADLIEGKLNIVIPKMQNGYLHTKLIVVKYENGFKLAVSTKNIVGSSSYDIIMGSDSVEAEPNTDTHGKIILEYIRSLTDKLPKSFNELQKYNFVPEKQGWTLDKIEIAYNKRFSDVMWDGLLSCDLMISPFIEETELNALKNKDNNVRLLSYKNSIDKFKDKLDAQYNNIHFYTGALGKKGVEHFHAKIYAKKEKENGGAVIYFGSANLTDQAHNKHNEILMKLTAPEAEYDKLSGIFKLKELVIPYKKAEYDEDKYEEDDDESVNVDALTKLYVSKEENGFVLHLKGKSYPFKEAVYFPAIKINNFETIKVYIRRENYDDTEAKKNGGLLYDDYIDLAEDNIKEMKLKSDIAFLSGTSAARNDGGSKAKGTAAQRVEPVPCIYNAIYSRAAKEMKDTQEDISEETVLKVLSDIKEQLTGEKYIGIINTLIEKVKGEEQNGTS